MMYKDKFVLSIIHDGYPVKETGGRYNRQVALPFDGEYKIRLKNKNDRSCTARVFIDGKKVSMLGDFVITAKGSVDLERFVDASLKRGKKFKFVSLDHKDVDDPTSSDNGIIKVEFRLAKEPDWLIVDPIKPWEPIKPWKPDDTYRWYYTNDHTTDHTTPVFDSHVTSYYCNSGGSSKMSDVSVGAGVKRNNLVKCSADVSPGATVEGGKSNQQFSYTHIEVGDDVTTLKLKIVGINDTNKIDRNEHKYCTNCGNKIRRTDKYCAGCGRKL